ncbi:MAG TPA: hypothetical protein VNX68_13770, partial [Nitrosopumilaceae archaeon]|nr:hypothetical protein [Nitrosopumilaceae archaeon]
MKKVIPVLSIFSLSLLISCGDKKEEIKGKEQLKDTAKVIVQEAVKTDTIVVYKYVGSDVMLDNSYIRVAPEAIKSILAYYCFQFNTGCPDKKHCKLTEALGLGEQNSQQHQDLVLKWFKDEDTKMSIANGGSVKPM